VADKRAQYPRNTRSPVMQLLKRQMPHNLLFAFPDSSTIVGVQHKYSYFSVRHPHVHTTDIRTFISAVLVRKYRICRETSSIQVAHLLPYFEFKILQQDGSTCQPLRRVVINQLCGLSTFYSIGSEGYFPWGKAAGV